MKITLLLRHIAWFLGHILVMPLKWPWRLSTRGFEHFPWRGAMILACNHQSFWDPPAAGAISPRPLSFMARDTLFRNPIFSALIRTFGAFPVARDQGDPRAIKKAFRILREGQALLVFPEGTRSRTGELGRGKEGVGMIALRTGAKVIPCYIHNTNRIKPKGALFMHFPKVTCVLGPAVNLDDLRSGDMTKEKYQQASDLIMAEIGKLKAGFLNSESF